jgi:hypothetical protein
MHAYSDELLQFGIVFFESLHNIGTIITPLIKGLLRLTPTKLLKLYGNHCPLPQSLPPHRIQILRLDLNPLHPLQKHRIHRNRKHKLMLQVLIVIEPYRKVPDHHRRRNQKLGAGLHVAVFGVGQVEVVLLQFGLDLVPVAQGQLLELALGEDLEDGDRH